MPALRKIVQRVGVQVFAEFFVHAVVSPPMSLLRSGKINAINTWDSWCGAGKLTGDVNLPGAGFLEGFDAAPLHVVPRTMEVRPRSTDAFVFPRAGAIQVQLHAHVEVADQFADGLAGSCRPTLVIADERISKRNARIPRNSPSAAQDGRCRHRDGRGSAFTRLFAARAGGPFPCGLP